MGAVDALVVVPALLALYADMNEILDFLHTPAKLVEEIDDHAETI